MSMRYVRVKSEDRPPTEGTTYCSREFERRPNAEFIGADLAVHIHNTAGDEHDIHGYRARFDSGDWVVEIETGLDDADGADDVGDQG